jgi:hypothetical protein
MRETARKSSYLTSVTDRLTREQREGEAGVAETRRSASELVALRFASQNWFEKKRGKKKKKRKKKSAS